MDREAKRAREWLIRDKYGGRISEDELRKDFVRIQNGEPVDYVIGWREFLGAHIDLSLKPLIPREETEYWVERAMAEIKKERLEGEFRILDLFSGSGAIGIALLKHFPDSCVDFGEIDANLLKQIRLNLKINKIQNDRFNVFETDVFSGITKKYDYIFANPPYLSREKLGEIQKSVLDFEPHKALFGEDGGMEYFVKLFSEGSQFPMPRGVIYFEFHRPQKERLEKLLKELGYIFELRKDQFDLYRWGRARLMV